MTDIIVLLICAVIIGAILHFDRKRADREDAEYQKWGKGKE